MVTAVSVSAVPTVKVTINWSKDQLFHQLFCINSTAEGFAKKVNSVPNSEVQNVFREYAGFELTPEELDALNHCKNYKNSLIPEK